MKQLAYFNDDKPNPYLLFSCASNSETTYAVTFICNTLYLSSPRYEPNSQLNVCTTSVTEGEVVRVKQV